MRPTLSPACTPIARNSLATSHCGCWWRRNPWWKSSAADRVIRIPSANSRANVAPTASFLESSAVDSRTLENKAVHKTIKNTATYRSCTSTSIYMHRAAIDGSQTGHNRSIAASEACGRPATQSRSSTTINAASCVKSRSKHAPALEKNAYNCRRRMIRGRAPWTQ